MKRFNRNNFFVEKNPTIVTFPVKNLQLADAVPVPPGGPSKYDLVANICHDGPPGAGSYRAQVLHRADGVWCARARASSRRAAGAAREAAAVGGGAGTTRRT